MSFAKTDRLKNVNKIKYLVQLNIDVVNLLVHSSRLKLNMRKGTNFSVTNPQTL